MKIAVLFPDNAFAPAGRGFRYKLLFCFVLVLLCEVPSRAQDTTGFPKFAAGLDFGPGICWYKTRQADYRKPDLLPVFNNGWGWGGNLLTKTPGLRLIFFIDETVSVSSGLYYGRRGGKLLFNDSVFVYTVGGKPAPLAGMDSSFQSGHPGYEKSRLYSRRFLSKYFIVPLLFRAGVPVSNHLSFQMMAGIQAQFLHVSEFTDTYSLINDTMFFSANGREAQPEMDGEMKKTALALQVGTEWQISNSPKNMLFTIGWNFVRGITNPVSRYSLYSMDEAATEAAFLQNGKAVAQEQRLHLNCMTFCFGLHFLLAKN